MKRILKKHMMAYLSDSCIISSHQHGFVSKKSCATNLQETLDIVTEALKRGFAIDLIFLYFAKAFDKVYHSGLLKKLTSNGFDDKIVGWISSFLSDRIQRVVIGEIASDWCELLSGMPQGSVLCPILFTVFINDMLTSHPCKLFADDSKIIGIIKTGLDAIQLQEDLNNLVKWFTDWRMLFNPGKCKHFALA